jgi:signal transduction histidine kinase
MAIRAVGKGGRAWSDALLGRPWLLVAAVALLVALPVLVLGQASENDTRARLDAAQSESAAHAADVVAASFNEREHLVQSTVATLAFTPRPDLSPMGLAVQHGDVATLQALVESVRNVYPRSVLRVYVATRGEEALLASGTIVAASPRDPISQRLPANLLQNCRRGCNEGDFFVTGGVGDDFAGTPDAPSWEPIVAVLPGPGQGSQERTVVGLAWITAEFDIARTFADAAVPSLTAGDDAYLLDGRRQLIGRARGATSFPLRDLSDDAFVKLLGPAPIVRADSADPMGGGTRLIASARVLGSDWRVLVLRDTTAIDREIDSVLGQLATARYVLVTLLVVGAILIAQAAGTTVRQRRALAAANARTEAASLHKSAFLSNMSHELRTPLNSINGFSDVLLAGIGGTLTEKQREYLADIRSSGEHLLALVNDVLDLSKVEAGKMELQPVEFDLRETIQAVHRVVAPLAQQKGQKLELEIGDIGTVRLDQGRLRQVLLNVLSNAVKYTPDGGSVTTGAQRRGESIMITVRDTGVGIAKADQARVFDDFTRIESGYARTQQGTGLGLSLARRLVRHMGGDITLDSEPGRGSTFTITLPAA